MRVFRRAHLIGQEKSTPRFRGVMKAGFKAPIARDMRCELWVKLCGDLRFDPISELTHATQKDARGRLPAAQWLDPPPR